MTDPIDITNLTPEQIEELEQAELNQLLATPDDVVDETADDPAQETQP